MKKKLLAIFVILTLLFTFTACKIKSAAEALQLIDSSMDTSKDTEFDIDFKMNMKMNEASQSIDIISTEGNMKFKSVDGKPQYYMSQKGNFAGIDIDALMILADGKAYYELNGQKVEMDAIDIEKEFNNMADTKIAEDYIKSFTTTKEGNNTVYNIVIDVNKLTKDYIKEFFMDENIPDGNATFDDCKVTIKTDSKDNPLYFDIILKGSFNFMSDKASGSKTKNDGNNGNQLINFEINYSLKFNSVKDVQIDLSKLQ